MLNFSTNTFERNACFCQIGAKFQKIRIFFLEKSELFPNVVKTKTIRDLNFVHTLWVELYFPNFGKTI